MDAPFHDLVAAALENTDSPHVVVSPVVWLPNPDGTKRWSFYVCSSEKGRGYRSFGIQAEDKDTADAARASVYFALMQVGIGRKGGFILHDCDDELAATKLCEKLWPGERITELRRDIERERAEWAA
jgi:hypothetical protein